MSERQQSPTSEAWIREALELLRSRGIAGVSVVAMARSLGVPRSAFYACFEDMEVFLEAVLSYWAETTTLDVRDDAERNEGTPQDRLRHLSAIIQRVGAAGYDTAVRAWAAFDRKAWSFVKHADRVRFDYVERLFREMGFTEHEIRLRARIFIHDAVASASVLSPRPKLREQERVAVVEKLLEP